MAGDDLSRDCNSKMEFFSTKSRVSTSVMAESRAEEILAEDSCFRLGAGVGDKGSGGWKSNEKGSRL